MRFIWLADGPATFLHACPKIPVMSDGKRHRQSATYGSGGSHPSNAATVTAVGRHIGREEGYDAGLVSQHHLAARNRSQNFTGLLDEQTFWNKNGQLRLCMCALKQPEKLVPSPIQSSPPVESSFKQSPRHKAIQLCHLHSDKVCWGTKPNSMVPAKRQCYESVWYPFSLNVLHGLGWGEKSL